ncbi:hypothetical protein [Neobacillus muris]|uniref:hypothetical protein n=1 Tax=Neobacillus muris TaxID=2941334 RepID=UPI0020400517|nr:hypothetical protein [Neobacillus muris]
MISAAILFFILSAILLLGAGKHIVDLSKPGVYPPKQMIKKRTVTLSLGAGLCFLIAILFSNL